MQPNERAKLAASIAVTAEMVGHEIKPSVADAMSRELAEYPPDLVADSLRRCARECRGRLTLADVISRIDDGHPGADQAWAICHCDESTTIVWTDEMSESYGVVRHLAQEDPTAARMAFRDVYTKALLLARNGGKRAQWTVSLGTDPSGRRAALQSAVDAGRLPAAVLSLYLPHVALVPKALPRGDVMPIGELVAGIEGMRARKTNGGQS